MHQFLLILFIFLPALSDAFCEPFIDRILCEFVPANVIDTVGGVARPDLCQEECLRTEDCQNFTWIDEQPQIDSFRCHLFKTCDVQEICPDENICLSGPRAPGLIETCCSFDQSLFCADQTHLIGFIPEGDPFICQRECRSTLGCEVFSSYGDICFLHSSCDLYEDCTECLTGGTFPDVRDCDSEPEDEGDMNVFIIGGYGGLSGEYLTSVEVLTPASSCSSLIPPLPLDKARYGAVASLLNTDLVLCGGTDQDGVRDDCVSIDVLLPQTGWTERGSMRERRIHASAVVVSGKMFVIGGYSDRFANELSSVESTSLETGFEWSFEPAMELPEARQMHCAMAVGMEDIVVAGGIGHASAVVFAGQQQEWRPLPEMPTERFDHACALVTLASSDGARGIIVTGGSSFLEEFIADTIFLRWETQLEWESMGDLWSPRRSHGVENLAGIPTVFGGFDFILKRETDVIEVLEENEWIDSRRRLMEPRMYFAKAKVHRDLVNCG